MRREWLRVRGFLAKHGARLRWVPEAVALLLAALVVAVTLRATAKGADWTSIFRSQALNIVFGALLAGFAYLLFFLRFRQAQLNTYLARSRVTSRRTEDSDPLAKTIVDELLDARPPYACLIKGPAGTEHARLLADVAAQLASRRWPNKRRVPVVVDIANQSDANLPALTRDRFVSQLVGSSGDEANGRRLYASLVKKEKVVALVKGLDEVGLGKPLSSRRAALAELLEGSLAEGIPFVAWVSEDLAPSLSEVAAFRVRPMPDTAFERHILQKLQPRDGSPDLRHLRRPFRNAFDDLEPTRDVALLHLALDVLVRRVLSGQVGREALHDLFSDRCAVRRHLAWMCDWTLGIVLGDINGFDSPALLALEAIGTEAHYQREPQVTWDDASRAMDADDKRRFAAGVASLSQRGVLTVTGSGSGRVIRFTHPMWFAFAGTLGLKVEPANWRDLLQPGVPVATLDALTGALMTFGWWKPPGRSFVRVLEHLGAADRTDISLEMVRTVIVALQADGEPLDVGERELLVLEESWSAANDLNKLRFISAVEFGRDPKLIRFLWGQVVYPRFDENRFRVRRAICTRLGQLGSAAWKELSPTWQDLVNTADPKAIAASSRGALGWKRSEYPLASLGWVLPGLLLTIDRNTKPAYELLRSLRALQIGDEDEPRDLDSPEIGLEISLAEGFKAAAVETFSKGSANGIDTGSRARGQDGWWSEAFALLASSKSWIGQQALVQALAVARPIAPPDVKSSDVRERLRPWEESEAWHPFVRETTRLVGRALDEATPEQKGEGSAPLRENEIWYEAVEALEDGGVTLSPEAHRLLALTTLLINLAEWRAKGRAGEGPDEEAVKTRDDVLSGVELPMCFRRSDHAATMHEVDCSGSPSCPFYLCGPDALKGVLEGGRVFSRSFLQRAQVTAASVPSMSWVPLVVRRAWFAVTARDRGRLAVGRAFGPVWKFLDKELQSPEGSP